MCACVCVQFAVGQVLAMLDAPRPKYLDQVDDQLDIAAKGGLVVQVCASSNRLLWCLLLACLGVASATRCVFEGAASTFCCALGFVCGDVCLFRLDACGWGVRVSYAPTALAACCGFDLCHTYIWYLYLYLASCARRCCGHAMRVEGTQCVRHVRR